MEREWKEKELRGKERKERSALELCIVLCYCYRYCYLLFDEFCADECRNSCSCCLMNNAVDGTEMDAEAIDVDEPAAESNNSRRLHPASRFEVLLNMHRATSINGHLSNMYGVVKSYAILGQISRSHADTWSTRHSFSM